MRAGKMDRRIAVQSFTQTEDDLGTPVQSWTTAQSLWASISYGTGQERREAAQEQSSLVATFIVRSSTFTQSITPQSHRISFDGLFWDIESAVPSVKRGVHISLTAKARTS